jgi:hypothetical protein
LYLTVSLLFELDKLDANQWDNAGVRETAVRDSVAEKAKINTVTSLKNEMYASSNEDNIFSFLIQLFR